MCSEQESYSPEVDPSVQNPDPGILERLRAFDEAALSTPELTRRTIIKGLGALIGLTAFQGVAALRILSREDGVKPEVRLLEPALGDACAEAEPACMAIQAGEQRQLIRVSASEAAAPPPETTTTNLPPTTTSSPPPTTLPSPPPAPPEARVSAASEGQWELPSPERRRLTYEEFAPNAELMISKLPTLEVLHSMFPSAFFNNIEEQKQHIESLNQAVQLDPAEYVHFGFDESRVGTFTGNPMNPRMLIWHWTGDHYETPDDIIRVLKNAGNSVHSYIHHDALPHRFADLGTILGHALGQNMFAMGLEVYSGHYDNVRSPVFGFDAARTKMGLYASVNMLHANGLPVNHTTLLSHFAGDLIFGNPYYDPYTGTFHEVPGHKPPHVRKFDQPQEFMQMIIPKAMALDAALHGR